MCDYDTLTKQSLLNAAVQAEEMNLFVPLRPKLTLDGDQFCVLHGDDLQTGVAGFGNTPERAIWAFNKAWGSAAPLPFNA